MRSRVTLVAYILLLIWLACSVSGCVFVAMGALAAVGIGKAIEDDTVYCDRANNLCEGETE